MAPRLSIAIPALLAAAPAAAELPLPVRAMIEAAIASGDAQTVAAVAGVARTTNPADGAEIDAMLAPFNQAQSDAAAAASTSASASASAQQAEQAQAASLLGNWSGEGQIGAFQSSGNTDNIGVSAGLSLEQSRADWSHRLRLAADYQRTNGQTSREQWQASYEPHYRFDESLFLYGFAQYERDRFQGFSARYSLSGGVGYHMIDLAALDLSLKAGPAYRETDFVNGSSSSNLAALIGVDFDWQLAENLKLTHDTSAVAEGGGEALVFIDSDNTSIDAVTGLEMKVSDRMTARFAYTVQFDTNPPQGAVNTDTQSRLTLVYGF